MRKPAAILPQPQPKVIPLKGRGTVLAATEPQNQPQTLSDDEKKALNLFAAIAVDIFFKGLENNTI
jgi:hypothetical protein